MAPSKRKRSTPYLQTFHPFLRLPIELRCDIYTLALKPRTITLIARDVCKVAWHEIHAVTGHKYPTPTRADRVDAHGNQRVATFECLYAASSSVALLQVSRESRDYVRKLYNFSLESWDATSAMARKITPDVEILEDKNVERGWAREQHMETPRFLVRKKKPQALCRINPSLDILFLDSGKLDMLYLAKKWLPGDFIRSVRCLAMTFAQLRRLSNFETQHKLGACLYQFTALKELIVLTEPECENIWIGHLGGAPVNNESTRRRVMLIMNRHLDTLHNFKPRGSNWERPILKVLMDERSLKKLLKEKAC